MDDADILNMLIDNGFWSNEEEAELNSFIIRLDAVKAEMYTKYISFMNKQVENCRKMLERMRKRYSELSSRRHYYDLYGVRGFANLVSTQYLISKNVKDINGQILNVDEMPGFFLENLTEAYLQHKPSEEEIRALAKNGKWRMIWSSGRQEGRVFGVPSIFLTEDQQSLISWSKLYDNIMEHPEPPPQEVIDDNDMLDGWIVVEQKKRENDKSKNNSRYDSRGGEVFLPAETPEDAKRVNALNSSTEDFIKKQRMAALKKLGKVNEEHMPDSRQKIATQAIQSAKNKMKGK